MSIRIGRLKEVIGKTINALVVRNKLHGDTSPGDQLFIVFDDGTFIEIYGELHNGSVHPGNKDYVEVYASHFGEGVQVIGDS